MKFKVWILVIMLVLIVSGTAAAQFDDPLMELGSIISQKYPDVGAIKKQFGNEAIWEESTEPNRHDEGALNIIRTMKSPGIEIVTLEVPHYESFWVISVVVENSGIEEFLGIDIGFSRGDVINAFGDPHETQDNKFIYSDEEGFYYVDFTIENDKVTEMRFLLFVD